MTGKKNGVTTKLKELNPVLISVHCICHKLALACTDTNRYQVRCLCPQSCKESLQKSPAK